MKNLLPNLRIENLLAPVAKTATFNSLIFDTSGHDGSFVAQIHVGADTGTLDGSSYYTPKFQESDTTVDGDFTDVAAGNILDAFPVLNAKATYENKTVVGECLPTKRFVRVVMTETGTCNVILGLTGMMGYPNTAPIAYTGNLAADGDAQT